MFKESIFNCYFYSEDQLTIFNSLSKASCTVESKTYIREAIIRNNHEEIVLLEKNGFIVDENIDEFKVLRYVFYKNYFNNTSLALILMPTLSCNFDCPYCFEKNIRLKENQDYFKILKKFTNKNLDKFKDLYIGLFGGEPLLKKKEIVSFLEEVNFNLNKRGKKLFTSVVTNGSLLDDRFVS